MIDQTLFHFFQRCHVLSYEAPAAYLTLVRLVGLRLHEVVLLCRNVQSDIACRCTNRTAHLMAQLTVQNMRYIIFYFESYRAQSFVDYPNWKEHLVNYRRR